jgi:hypothetical protein
MRRSLVTTRRRRRTTKREVPRAKRPESLPPPPKTTPKAPAKSSSVATAPELPALPRARIDHWAVTRPEVPRAKRRGAFPEGAEIPLPDRPATLRLPTPDPIAARYSLIPRRTSRSSGFPGFWHYVESLPDGLDSYPALRVKGAVVHAFLLDPLHPPTTGQGLPKVLDELSSAMPSVNDWIPFVHLSALHAAAYDSVFADLGRPAYEDWCYERDLRMLRAPAFRKVFAVEAPELLLPSVAMGCVS